MLPLMLLMVLMVWRVLIIHSVYTCDGISDFGGTHAVFDSDGAVGVIGAGNVHSTGCADGSVMIVLLVVVVLIWQ